MSRPDAFAAIVLASDVLARLAKAASYLGDLRSPAWRDRLLDMNTIPSWVTKNTRLPEFPCDDGQAWLHHSRWERSESGAGFPLPPFAASGAPGASLQQEQSDSGHGGQGDREFGTARHRRDRGDTEEPAQQQAEGSQLRGSGRDVVVGFRQWVVRRPFLDNAGLSRRRPSVNEGQIFRGEPRGV